MRFLEEESITLARWNEDARQFDAVRGASYDAAAGVLQAKLDSGGRYGVVGASRWSHAYDFQRRICDPGAFNLDLDRQLIDRLCLVILCAPFDAAAWGDAWQQQSGEFIPPDAVGGHFNDLCDRCTGVPRIPAPECEVGVFVPGGSTVGPPELEQIPNGIENGGRAVAISIAPGDDDKMIVASETGGLFRSLNRGAAWTHVSSDHTFDFTDVHHDPTDAAVIVSGARRDTKVVNGGGIWRSDDGGGSWAQRPLSPAVATCADELTTFGLDYEAEDQRFWAATSCGVASSDDGGSTWSFLPAAPGYNHDKAYAVVAPAAGNLKLLTDAGVRVTTDGGAGWNVSNTGLPSNINKGVHNQIAVSPLDASQIYWAFNYWVWDADDEKWRGRWALYLSIDDGASWSEVFDEAGINRPPFVRIGSSPSGESDEYAVYYSNGGCTFRRATATHGSPPTFSAWTALTVDHCDVSDLAFANDGSTPLLLASDGGLHTTADGGLNWSFTGGVSAGYNALQITEVTGQMDSVLGTDLYFATQDNHIWASPNGGITWPGKRCCAFSAAADKIDNLVEVGTSQKRGAAYKDKKLAQILKAGNQIRGLLLEGGKLRGLLIASREIVAEDLPKQKKLGPYIVVRVPADGGVSLERAGSIVVVGEGFAPEVPIEISVDGVPLELEEPVVVGKDGRFETNIPPTFGVGGHTVRVEQRVGQEVFRDAYSFNLTVEDLPAAADEVN